MSSNCEGYAKPSLCYSAFPICRNSANTQKSKNTEASTQLFNLLNSKQDDFLDDGDRDDADDFAHRIPKKRSPTMIPNYNFMPEDSKSHNKKIINQSYGDARSAGRNEINRKLRRICREECEMLENELCRKEYAIAKRHPLIGHQVPLVECSELPLEGTTEARDCLTLGLSAANNVQENDYCFWGSGKSYRGTVKTSASGRPCLRWSYHFNLPISDYPELAGRHSYCRNPGGKESQPWCYVDVNNRMQKEFCNIPKCGKLVLASVIYIYLSSHYTCNKFNTVSVLVENLWIYGVVGFVIMGGFVTIFICYCCCYRSKKSRRQMNHLPSNKVNICTY